MSYIERQWRLCVETVFENGGVVTVLQSSVTVYAALHGLRAKWHTTQRMGSQFPIRFSSAKHVRRST